MLNYLKPQTPIELGNNYIYPLTTADQVILNNGNRLNSLFKKTIKETATLQVANWSDTKPYTQTITLTESTDDYNVDANIVYNGNEADTELNKAAGCISYIKKNHKEITFYCLKEKPMINIPVEITGTCRNTIADVTIEEGIKLNFDIIGNPRPKTGDTLYWDGNTEGRECYNLGSDTTFYKVSDVIPTLNDFSKGVYGMFTMNSGEQYVPVDDINYFNNDIWISNVAIIVDRDNAPVSKGIYFLKYKTYYVSYAIVPGFTGFEKDDIEVKENTIWVDTDVPITGYKFSATEPEDVVEGKVWIGTGAVSSVEFDVVDGFTICPLFAKQYVDGAWVNVTTMSYQDEEWVKWVRYLYNNGDQCVNLSGGWKGENYHSSYQLAGGNIAINNDCIVVNAIANGSIAAITNNPIDLTNCDKIRVAAKTAQGAYEIAVNKVFPADSFAAKIITAISTTEKENSYIDVSSLTGEYYIAIASVSQGIPLYIYEVEA